MRQNQNQFSKLARGPQNRNRKAQTAEAYTGVMFFYMIASVITKVLGFGREIFITSRFGYGIYSDAYSIGFAIPDLVYQLLVGGAISSAVMPVLSGAIEKDEEAKVWKPISTFFTVIFICFFAFMFLGEVFSKELIDITNPNKLPETLAIASSVSRVIFLQTFFFILVAIMTTVLSANKVFGLQAFGDSIYNLFSLMSIAILGAESARGVINVSWGIVFAAAVYFFYMYFLAKPYLGFFRPNLQVKNPQFKRILFLAIPPILSGSVGQISMIVRQSFADQFAGAVTSLRNAATLYNLPFQIIAYSIGTMMLPNIAGFLSRGAHKEASAFFTRTMRLVIYLLLPCAIFFFVAAEETVQAVFQWNVEKYPMHSVVATASLLKIYAVDMLIQAIAYLLNQLFFAKQKNWIAMVTAILNLLISPILMVIFLNVFHLGLAGLAWATVITNITVLIITLVLRKRYVAEVTARGLPQFLVKVVVAGFTTFSVLLLAKTILDNPARKILQLTRYGVLGIVVVICYVLATSMLDMKESKMVFSVLNKFYRKVSRMIRR